MAVTRILSNKFKLEFGKGEVDFSTDVFRIILMKDQDTFTFDRTTHQFYSDISADELDTEYGYTQITKVLDVDSVWAQDDVNHKATISWQNVIWSASAGNIGPTGTALVLQYDSDTPDNSLIVGAIDFGEDITAIDGVNLELKDLGFDLSQKTA